MESHNRDNVNSDTLQLFLATIPSILHDARKYALIIDGFVELLHREQTGPLNEQQKELSQEALSRTKMLFHILNQALMLSSIDIDPREPMPIECDIADILEEALQRVIQRNKQKSEALQIIQHTEHFRVFVDSDDIVQAFQQLLDNAIKYTQPQGRIIVLTKEESNRVTITIQDTGVGIPPEQQSRIFQRLSSHFQHLPHELSSSGIGLAIAHALIKRNSGTIELTETDSEGSIFTITLPTSDNTM